MGERGDGNAEKGSLSFVGGGIRKKKENKKNKRKRRDKIDLIIKDK